jgi:ABC-type Fe3+/spermidine/putrescine transport system ATPase subunit
LESPLGQLTPNATGFTSGQPVTIVLRPTAFRLFSTPLEGQIKATVRSASFLGGVRRYVVQVADLRLIVDQPATEFEASEGDVWLSIDPRAGFHVLAGGRE